MREQVKEPEFGIPIGRQSAVGQAKVSDFVEVIGLSEGRVRDLLRKMVGDGTIEKIGNNRYTQYILKS